MYNLSLKIFFFSRTDTYAKTNAIKQIPSESSNDPDIIRVTKALTNRMKNIIAAEKVIIEPTKHDIFVRDLNFFIR
jgi:hypothetical protein